MKVIIDPRSNYAYSSMYVYGLIQIGASISYSMSPFSHLNSIERDLRFIVKQHHQIKKVFVHANDSYHIIPENYEWCDVYGCVNANFEHFPKEKYPKVVSLAPSFAIRQEKNISIVIYEAIVQLFSIWHDVINKKEWNKSIKREEGTPLSNIKHYFGRRFKMWKNRLPISAYTNTVSSDDSYIFFLCTLWYSDEWNNNDEGVNLRRAHFIRACKAIPNCQFEGGLLGDASSSNDLFSDVLTMHRMALSEWIEKTKRSALVFNTPAFWDCHGWKLGEYLALGKCIVSTKLSNDLPYPLEHGKNIHFVEDTEKSMREAIEYILAHPDYRHKLERGAKEYWEKYGTPEASLRLLGIEKNEEMKE